MTEVTAQAQTSSIQDTSAATNIDANTTEWTSGFAPEETEYVKNKGWKDPRSVLNSYKELEKFRGADEKSLIKLPNKDAKPEDWDAVWNKLGRPESPDKYELTAPEGVQVNDDAVKWFRETAHKKGLSANTAKEMFNEWNKFGSELQQKMQQEKQASHTRDLEVLKSEWGADYTAKEEYARRGGKALGLDENVLNEIGDKIGTANLYKMLYKAGELAGEIKRPDAAQSSGSTADQDAALKKIAELTGNKEFYRKLNIDKDPAAINEWNELHKKAYPSKN